MFFKMIGVLKINVYMYIFILYDYYYMYIYIQVKCVIDKINILFSISIHSREGALGRSSFLPSTFGSLVGWRWEGLEKVAWRWVLPQKKSKKVKSLIESFWVTYCYSKTMLMSMTRTTRRRRIQDEDDDTVFTMPFLRSIKSCKRSCAGVIKRRHRQAPWTSSLPCSPPPFVVG